MTMMFPDPLAAQAEAYRRKKQTDDANSDGFGPASDPDGDELPAWDFGAAKIVPAEIPPRGWLLGNLLCRQFVSSVFGDGAVGKTAFRIVCALSLATERRLLDYYVFQRCRVLFICFEDSETELKRRVVAAMIEHKITDEDITGYFYVCSINDPDLKLAVENRRGDKQAGSLGTKLRNFIVKHQIDAVFLDPFVKTHTVSENDNSSLDYVAGMLAELAIDLNIAVDCPHHVRKGSFGPGNADAGRGGSSLKDAMRLVYTLTTMTAKEAELFDIIDAVARRSLIRHDSAKVNISAPATEAKWFRLVSVAIGNPTDLYPRGDEVQTVIPWSPPSFWKLLTIEISNKILDQIEKGPAEGRKYSDQPPPRSGSAKKDTYDRLVWPVFEAFCPELTIEQSRLVVKKWLATGVLDKRDYDDPVPRKKRKGLFVLKRPG